MKIEIWTVASDTDSGTQSNVFTTEEAYLAHLADLMGLDPKKHDNIEELFQAWSQNEMEEFPVLKDVDPKHSHLDTYSTDYMEIDVPVKVVVNASGGLVRYVNASHEGINVVVCDEDGWEEPDQDYEGDSLGYDECRMVMGIIVNEVAPFQQDHYCWGIEVAREILETGKVKA